MENSCPGRYRRRLHVEALAGSALAARRRARTSSGPYLRATFDVALVMGRAAEYGAPVAVSHSSEVWGRPIRAGWGASGSNRVGWSCGGPVSNPKLGRLFDGAPRWYPMTAAHSGEEGREERYWPGPAGASADDQE